MGISKGIKVKTIAIDEARINAISIKFDNVYRESVLQFQNFCFACFLVSVTVMVTLGSLVALLCKIIFGMQQFPEKLMIWWKMNDKINDRRYPYRVLKVVSCHCLNLAKICPLITRKKLKSNYNYGNNILLVCFIGQGITGNGSWDQP